jgi:outer membrane protein assembly factor BamB
VNLSNGTQKWRFPAEPDNRNSFYAPPAISPDNQLITGGYNHILYSLDPADGSVNWEFAGATNRYIATPLVEQSGIYAPAADETLYALDLAGQSRWELATPGESWAAPVTDESCSCLYLTSLNHLVFAVDPTRGSQIWESQSLGGSVVGSPAHDPEGVLYVGTFGNEVIAMNTKENGKVIWRAPTEGWVWSGPTLADGRLYAGDLNGNLYAFNAGDGTEIWQVAADKLDGKIVGSPLVIEQDIYIGTESGKLFNLDTSGNIKWTQTLTGKLYTSPVAAGDLILAAATGSEELLTAFNREGAKQWSFLPEPKKEE